AFSAYYPELEHSYVRRWITFSGGGAESAVQRLQSDIQVGRWESYASTLGPDGATELMGEMTHGRNLGGRAVDFLVASVPRLITLPHAETEPGWGSEGENMWQPAVVGVKYTIKFDSPFELVGKLFGGLFGGGRTARQTEAPDVGGVLINKAARWVGSNLCDIVGAAFDPVSHQIVFLGTNDETAVRDINLDYFYTAVQAVYGSAMPPFVTLDPPASMYSPWIDFGDGDGVFEEGESGGFILYYSPIWVDSNDDLRVRFRMHWGDQQYDFTAYIDAWENTHITAGGRHLMELTITNWSDRPPGIEVDEFRYTQIHLSGKGQDSYYVFTLTNSAAGSLIVDSVNVIPNLQHRRYGGRVDGTRLGWVMYEADRVMKCLAVGVDNLTGEIYDSTTVPVPGYSNVLERCLGTDAVGNVRFWFVPNEMTLKKYVDPQTGEAAVIFDRASVSLKTESFMRGLPQSPVARAFADHFNEHYDDFAALEWPVLDPDDPTGQTIIHVRIFERLREAMQAVALARFFRDNGIPLDMWWLNSWRPPQAYSPRTVPSAYNEATNGTQWVLIYGGVEVNKPNSYVPSPEAEQLAEAVAAQRPDLPGDLDGQVWDVSGTPKGDLKAVAASFDRQMQDGNLRFVEADLAFATPGDTPLALVRCYDSAFAGDEGFGPGWHPVRFALQFSRPSWYDENGLMRDAQTNAVWTDSRGDTRLRSGEIRFVDYLSGRMLNFYSSLSVSYNVDSLGNPIISLSGLDSNGVPTFYAGEWADGSELVQLADSSRGYRLTRTDGTELYFDHEGRLLSIVDRFGLTNSWHYADESALTGIVDCLGRTISFDYDASNHVVAAWGPAGEHLVYSYDALGRLTNVWHERGPRTTTYAYDDDGRISTIVTFDGITQLNATNDLRSRVAGATDRRGAAVARGFEIDPQSLSWTESISNLTAGAVWKRVFDSEGRLLRSEDPWGNAWQFEYSDTVRLPTLIRPPIPGREPIRVQRNVADLPVRIEDPENVQGHPVEITYNEANLPVVVTDVLARAIRYGYDQYYNLVSVTRELAGRPVTWSFGYECGRLVAVTNPLGAVSRFERDEFGRITNIVDATGIAVSLSYDQFDRLVEVRDPRLSGPVRFTYNDFDQIVRVESPAGTNTYGYDPQSHRLVAVTNANGGVVRYSYDPVSGDLVSVLRENPGYGDVTYSLSYDALGRVTNVVHPNGQQTSFAYDPAGRLLRQAEHDHRPPGPPQLLKSDRAFNGIWTNASDHSFTWAAPECDSGIEGYSVGLDVAPGTNLTTSEAAFEWLGVPEGVHTVAVRACSRSGLWGPTAEFILRLDYTSPSASGSWMKVQSSDCGPYVVGQPVSVQWGGFTDTLSGVGGYYCGFSDNCDGTHHVAEPYADLSGAPYDTTSTVYLRAHDRAGNLSPVLTTNILILDPDGDWDGDGMANSDEEVAGTRADDAGSAFYITPELHAGGDELLISWFGASNRVYDLLVRETFAAGSWQEVDGWTNIAGHGSEITYTDSTVQAEFRLYRVRVRRP
ncbi:MAG: hypothetical protein DRP22_04465, partial [Verrucomicrobia bacterium]